MEHQLSNSLRNSVVQYALDVLNTNNDTANPRKGQTTSTVWSVSCLPGQTRIWMEFPIDARGEKIELSLVLNINLQYQDCASIVEHIHDAMQTGCSIIYEAFKKGE